MEQGETIKIISAIVLGSGFLIQSWFIFYAVFFRKKIVKPN